MDVDVGTGVVKAEKRSRACYKDRGDDWWQRVQDAAGSKIVANRCPCQISPAHGQHVQIQQRAS